MENVFCWKRHIGTERQAVTRYNGTAVLHTWCCGNAVMHNVTGTMVMYTGIWYYGNAVMHTWYLLGKSVTAAVLSVRIESKNGTEKKKC